MATKPAETNSIQGYQLCKRYEHAIQLLGKRWTGLILDTLMAGPRRFCEMTAAVEGCQIVFSAIACANWRMKV